MADVDPLASVLRVHSDAQIVVSAATARECDNLKRLLPYRGVDESRVSISPGGPAQVTVTKGH